MAMSMSATYTGRVVSVNPKGLKLDGHDDWYNVSKFATDVILPERGETVTVVVDGKARAPRQSPADRERTITRLAVLKAAAEYSASKPESKSGDVLKIAESWEKWILRTDEPEEDNVDAF
jgi:hypothetical protein